MRLLIDRLVVATGQGEATAPITGSGPIDAGPLQVDVGDLTPGEWTSWTLANRADAPVGVVSASIVFRVEASHPLRMFRHGYQSWSPSSVATFGVDDDPSRTEGAVSLVMGMHHADAAPAWPGELRSEFVTTLRDGSGSLLLAGFDGASEHDGTLRLRSADGGDGGAELWVEAYLGGAVLEPGEIRSLHAFTVRDGDDASVLLEAWAADVGGNGGGRTTAPYQAGWCSWYHYFHGVTEADVRANLARAGDWPFAVFQVDDGFQADIGDWLATNDKFPAPLSSLAGAIAAAGRRPGIWIAPFLAGPASALALGHPGWIAGHRSGRPLVGMVNDGWGGAVLTLDTTNPEVLDHLAGVARSLVEWGFTYVKLDFTYAPSLDGVYADPSRTPAQRVRAGFEAIRRGAGDGAFLLGCGAPLGACVGVVDGMRIGPDVAPWWDIQPRQWRPPGYEHGEPATRNAFRNTLTRSFQHRRLWLNDPDCVMLRTRETQLTPAAARAWALAVGVSGGMALVSDDLALLGPAERALLDEVLELGRAADAEAADPDGHPARCDDLLDHATPGRLRAAGMSLTVDADAATATLQPELA